MENTFNKSNGILESKKLFGRNNFLAVIENFSEKWLLIIFFQFFAISRFFRIFFSFLLSNSGLYFLTGWLFWLTASSKVSQAERLAPRLLWTNQTKKKSSFIRFIGKNIETWAIRDCSLLCPPECDQIRYQKIMKDSLPKVFF